MACELEGEVLCEGEYESPTRGTWGRYLQVGVGSSVGSVDCKLEEHNSMGNMGYGMTLCRDLLRVGVRVRVGDRCPRGVMEWIAREGEDCLRGACGPGVSYRAVTVVVRRRVCVRIGLALRLREGGQSGWERGRVGKKGFW